MAKRRGFGGIRHPDGIISRLVDELVRSFVDIDEIAYGRMLKDVALSATEASINHGLGQIPTGYVIVKRSAAQLDYTSRTADATNLYLKAAGAVTVDIWVF